ncbi:MAG: hypothetical protein CYPHOPRED_004366 [Cyphobasidiales sp. Tagirdzhanova-0007]|nr:MAG: hypothetical protein CYPHOPRED_004366 [Cyphobasidiales sp. Tagirdzhanova-0007]
MLGKALKNLEVPRENYVVLTKVFQPVKDGVLGGPRFPAPDKLDANGFVNQRGLSRKAHIFASVQASLKRLDIEYIDVLQCHRYDNNTPIEETMQALHDVVQKGWVRYIGMSSCWAWQFWKMQTYAINNRLTPFISMQNYHNATYREEEREMVPTLAEFGIGMIPWSPIARGFLARPVSQMKETTRSGGSDPMFSVFVSAELESTKEINKRVEKIAKETGHSMAQIAYAWSLAQPFVAAPIVAGSTKLSHLEEAIEATQIKLTNDQLKYINEPYTSQSNRGFS